MDKNTEPVGHGLKGCTKAVRAENIPTCAWFVIKFLGIYAKCLILKNFGINPDFLWITLLISPVSRRESLVNQGFAYAAQKKSKEPNPYKSTTYDRYRFNSTFFVPP
ncbi:MAG: hypothetical protein IPN06_09010 [Burkholderiales bacterium]|nr:hypothetical protein [Burkholderiales bacterium]